MVPKISFERFTAVLAPLSCLTMKMPLMQLIASITFSFSFHSLFWARVLGASSPCSRSACTCVDATVGLDLGSLAPIDGARY
jgi:hypothetical protein